MASDTERSALTDKGRWQALFTARSMASQWGPGLLWCETFIGVGLHCFWVLAKSTPLAVDNAWGALLAAVPFALMLVLGFGAFHRRIQASLINLERFFHAMACLAWTGLLAWVTLNDPLAPVAPLALPLALWSIGLCFILAANLSLHLRLRASDGAPCSQPLWARLFLAMICWAAMLWLAAGTPWAVYFWSTSIALHAALACAAARDTGPLPARVRLAAGFLPRYLTVTETLFLFSLILLAQVLVPSSFIQTGALETKFIGYLALFRSCGFFAGAALALAALRLRLTLFSHIAIAALLTFAARDNAWPLAAAFGYAFPMLYRLTRRQCGLCYALSCAAVSFGWLLGLTGFAFSGMIVLFDFGKETLHALVGVASVGLFISLALWMGGLFWKRQQEPRAHENRKNVATVAPDALLDAALFTGILLAALAPALLLLLRTEWPPRQVARPTALPVDTPMAVCHAGYSNSDEEYRLLKELGVQGIRADFHWSCFQPEPGRWDFECRDTFVDAAVRHGVQVIALLDFDNNAVEQDAIGKNREMYIAPPDIPLFLEYVRQVVSHYKDRVYAWEIWNEPDIDRFWTGSAGEFYALAAQTAQTVRAVLPAARIVGPAMTGPLGAWTPPNIDAIHAAGALKSVQHPSGHLYTTDPRHYPPEFSKIIGAARRFNHPGPVWITEVGAPSGGHYPWRIPTERLAEHLIKACTAALSMGIEKVVWYCLNDAAAASQAKTPIDSERFFGLIGPDGRWKPSAFAYRLFSRHCTHTIARPELVHTSGGLAARQLRSTLFRRANGESALILWFEPMLRPWGTARVRLDLGPTPSPPIRHDIGSDYHETLLDNHIDIGETPVFITFTTDQPGSAVRLTAESSPVDALWLLAAAVATAAAWAPGRRPGKRPAALNARRAED